MLRYIIRIYRTVSHLYFLLYVMITAANIKMFSHNISNYGTNLNDREYLSAQMKYDKTR